MKLTKIEIENYRSIKKEVINVIAVENSFCYGFLGINESGKSNLLKAIKSDTTATGGGLMGGVASKAIACFHHLA